MSQARFKPAPQPLPVEVSANQKPVRSFLVRSAALVERKSLADEVKEVSTIAFGHPQNAFATKHAAGKISIEEGLEFITDSGRSDPNETALNPSPVKWFCNCS